MKVIILAAGYGTRLYPLIKDTPKALLPINEKPLINYILDRIENLSDLNEVIVVTNNKFATHFQEWASQVADFPCQIRIVNDGTNTPEERLGSIGDIDFVLQDDIFEKDDVLVVGGDNLFDYNINEYVEFASKRCPSVSIGLYNIGSIEEAKQFGVVALDEHNKISSFEEKPQQPKSTLIAMCFYFLPKATLHLVADYLHKSEKSDKAGDYIRWLLGQIDVYGFQFRGTWFDIGSVEAYKEAQQKFK